MAIRKQNKVEVPQEEVPQEEVPQEEVPQEEVPQEEVRSVAVQNKKDVPVVGDVAPSLKSLENAYPPEEFGNLFPRIVGANGSLVNDSNNFGEFIDVQVVSMSDRWMVTPDAEQTDKKAKKLCRASYDGKTIPDRDGGESMSISEWSKEIEAAGYEVNNVSKYKDIFCVIFNSDKNIDTAADLGIVQISVSPTAVRTLKAFVMQTPITVKRGLMLPTHQNCLRILAVGVSGDISYTYMKFSAVPLDIVRKYEPVIDD